MRISRWFFALPLVTAFACTDPVKDDTSSINVQTLPTGVIQGSLLYQGPHPCSSNGHIIGNAILLVFDRRSPPPPLGLANTAVNFAAIPGDVLFASEPRWGGSTPYCPSEHGITDTVTANAPFAISPLAGASYLIESFFDTTGDFYPLLKFRNLPEKGDVGGGDIDTADALKALNQNPNYEPIFEPIDVGIPRAGTGGGGTLPLFDIPPEGYVADNVQVTVGQVLGLTRPYFYAQGLVASVNNGSIQLTQAQSSDAFYTGDKTGIAGSAELSGGSGADPAHYAPVLTIPQDIQSFAAPVNPLASGEAGAAKFEASLPHLRLRWAGSAPQTATIGVRFPFNMQITPFTGTPSGGGFRQWFGEYLDTSGATPIWKQQNIPDSVSSPPVPYVWPLVILSKLIDDPTHSLDPASVQAQGSATLPVVIMQGITLFGGANDSTAGSTTDADSLWTLGLSAFTNPTQFIDKSGNPVIYEEDHITAVLRPAVICFNTLFDPGKSDKRGQIVTPYLTGDSADLPTPTANTPIVPPDLLTNTDPARAKVTNLVKAPDGWKPGTPPALPGCLPKGRYAINVVYPDGQAWTVPNEAGACTASEGSANWNQLECQVSPQPRAIVQSQGPRAVVEVVGPSNPANCKTGAAVPPTPQICLQNPQ